MAILSRRKRQSEWSLRAFFEYDRDSVRLVRAQRVRMIAPPGDDVAQFEGRAGFWYELQDAGSRRLYGRVVDNPMRGSVEVRADDPDKPLRREGLREPRGEFMLIVPDLPAATQLVLFSSPLEPARQREPARLIGQFRLADVQGKGG